MWSITVGPVAPEIYAYNFTIDGIKTIDPGNYAVKTGSTAGTIESLLEVPGDRPRSSTRSRCRMGRYAQIGMTRSRWERFGG